MKKIACIKKDKNNPKRKDLRVIEELAEDKYMVCTPKEIEIVENASKK